MFLEFEWNEEKAQRNLKKHAVSFDEAISVFADPLAITIADPDHSSNIETRYIDIGISNNKRILVVVYIERNNKIRIISCRRATKYELEHYEQHQRRR
jgi:uncharacterized protein